MLRKSIYIILLFIPQIIFGQVTLIPNGDFEDYKWLPNKFLGFDIDSAVFGWNAPTNGTPDYFYNKIPKIPSDAVGYPADMSRIGTIQVKEFVMPQKGKGFCGLEFGVRINKEYNWTLIGTEFLQTKLLKPTKKNQKYNLKIYSRCSKITNSKFGQLGYTITQNELKNKNSTSADNPYSFRFKPHIKDYTNFSGTNNDTTWQLFDTIITFNEPKNYLTIGGFNIEFHPYTTDTFAYYYFFVDNISLVEMPAIQGPDKVCVGNSVKLYSTFSGPIEWWTNGNLVSSDSIYNFLGLKSGMYYIKAPIGQDSIYITVVENNIDEKSRVSELCEGENLKIDISDKFKAEWSDGIVSNHRIFIDNTRLSVMVSDKFCKKSIDVIINKKPLQKFDVPGHLDFCAFNDINYAEVELPNGITYYWHDTLSNSYRQFTQPGKYIFTYTDTNLCIRKDSIIVSDLCNSIVWLPNAFAPNGYNKEFKPYLKYIEQATLIIYNLWGEKIFEGSSESPAWDGYYQGRLCQQGVYFYTLEVIAGLKQTNKFFSGKIHLIN